MMEVFDVFISGELAGKIGKPPRRPVLFRLIQEYHRLLPRPVLGQQFEDKPRAKYSDTADELPPFFANLIPEEGPLKRIIEHSLGFTSRNDLALLVALGEGLPGAIEVRPGIDGANLLDATQSVAVENVAGPHNQDNTVFRFSLAGVQMKFSVLLDSDKLRLPMRDELGDWIVKFDSIASPNLPANEYAVMQWARIAKFDVPECRLLPVASLPQSLYTKVAVGTEVFLIRRYDRDNGRRIHQEDFAQVAGFKPELKYDHWSYEDCANVVRETCGEAQYEEFIRRLVFMVASGNTDAHLKNWSFLYPDTIHPQLTPLYDQVAVIAWPPNEPKMRVVWALEFNGTRFMEETDITTFMKLAERVGSDPNRMQLLVRDTLKHVVEAWHIGGIANLLPDGHAQAIKRHWQRVPLLRNLADALLVDN